jgi:chlorite dismutase
MPHAPSTEVSRHPAEGWHCTHIYYRFNRAALHELSPEERTEGRQQLVSILDPDNMASPARLQTSIVSGHKADFGLMLMDPDPWRSTASTSACWPACWGRRWKPPTRSFR